MRIFFRIFFILSLTVSNAFAAGIDQKSERARIREWVAAHASRQIPTIAPEENDQAVDLVDSLQMTSLTEMDQAGLRKAELPETPWSDSYWPTYAGMIANRYADPNYNAAMLWKDNYDYLSRNIGIGKTEELSPAEKYDLLLGDPNFSLTHKMIESGRPYADASGKVETWFGLCHGWAAASFMMPRPRRAIRMKAADGRELTFLPSDLKALATLLWADSAGTTRFVGGRCNDRRTKRDENSREINPDCFDTNPATWHLSVVNQIGVSQRSFVMDASAGFEVWNQPVSKYLYGYVNPLSEESTYNLTEAKVRLSDLKNDRYAAHRNPNTEYVVGIIMSVTYVSEVTPSTSAIDGPQNDSDRVVTYSYDLELDKEDRIIGGEWHSSQHPDFLWVPVKGAKANSVGDSWLINQRDRTEWNGHETIPEIWLRAASTSSRHGQPLARIVNKLFEMAN